jgi:hypothetical protein
MPDNPLKLDIQDRQSKPSPGMRFSLTWGERFPIKNLNTVGS